MPEPRRRGGASRGALGGTPAGAGRDWALRPVSVGILVVLLALTAVATWLTRAAVRSQESRLLAERAREVALVLDSSIGLVPTSLDSIGAVLRATNASPSAFATAASSEEAAGKGRITLALLRPAPGGYDVVAEAGPALVVGQVVTGPRAGAFRRAEHAGQLVATPLIGSGSRRALGFALGPPAAPAGEVLYEQAVIGPVSSPPRAATAPFSELNVVLYASPRAEPSQELFSTTPDLPLDRPSHFQSLVVGASDWLLGVNAPAPLVGSAEASALWAVMAVGVVVALLVTAVVEVGMRRRDAALALYAGEHDLAETLQRSLLPDLPALPGLELASRYLAGGRGQEVGGDWFDAFPLGGDRVGLVIGDVAGHDIAAAATMSQVRATVRAYAAQGDQPAAVLDRLDGLVGRFGVAQLVTVFYGALDPPGADGSRLLRYANAGHLPPLLEDPGGAVDSLAEGASVVIGAPMAGPRAQAERRLLPGSTLVLFTDGLVEVPGRSLEDCLVELADSVAADHPPTRSPEQLCEHLVSAAPGGQLRDDVALLAVRVLVTQPAAPVSPAPAAVVPSAAHLGEVRADVPGSQGAGRLVPPLEGPGPEPGRGGGRLG